MLVKVPVTHIAVVPLQVQDQTRLGMLGQGQLLWNSGVASVVVEQSLLNKGRGAEALQYADARCSLVIEFYSSIDDYSTYRTTAPKFED